MASPREVITANEAFKRVVDDMLVLFETQNRHLAMTLVNDIRLVGNFIESQIEYPEKGNDE